MPGDAPLNLPGFALAVLLIELTPGPNMAWLAGLSATEGKRVGLMAGAGVALGLLANGVLAALGLAVLLQNAPQLWHGLRLAGVAMMTWLAVATWRGAGHGARPAPAHLAVRAFSTGAMVNLLNPKAYIFFVVVAPQFMSGAALRMADAILLSVVSMVIATTVHTVVVLAGSRAHRWVADPRRSRTVRRCFAMMMLAVAASFALSGSGGPRR